MKPAGAWLLFLLTPAAAVRGQTVSFTQVLDRAQARFQAAIQAAPAAAAQPAIPKTCPLRAEPAAELAAQLAAHSEFDWLDEPAALPATEQAAPLALDSPPRVTLCAALTASALATSQAQQQALRLQQQYVARLLEIESRRVLADVDPPLELVEARLLRARTRLEAGRLAESAARLRQALAALTGLPEAGLELDAASLPPLPAEPLPENGPLRQLGEWRDVAQLDYAAEAQRRLKAAHDSELGRASVGLLVAAHATEQMKLIALMALAGRVRAARLKTLAEAGLIEPWARGEFRRPLPAKAPDAAQDAATDAAQDNSRIVTLILAPPTAELAEGRSQQFSAIATDAGGHARDVTAEAEWSTPSEPAILLSSIGLATALSPGEATVRVEFGGLSRERSFQITPAGEDPYLTPAKSQEP